MDKDIYIIGAGTYGEAMFELAILCGYNPIGFFDDDDNKKGNIVMDIPVLGKLNSVKFSIANKNFAVAIGNNGIRIKKMNQLLEMNAFIPSLVHPTANVSKFAVVNEIGCYIHANTYLWTKVQVNRFCIISPSVMIAHHTILEEGSFISAGSNVGAGICIENSTFIGIGSTIMTGVKKIARYSVIGAGSVVIRNTKENGVYAGVPAKLLRITKKD